MNYASFMMLFGLTLIYMINYLDTQVASRFKSSTSWKSSSKKIAAVNAFQRKKSLTHRGHHHHHHDFHYNVDQADGSECF